MHDRSREKDTQGLFTGHRPEKLTRSERDIKTDLEIQIRQAVAGGLNVYITGMARGVDIWAAQVVLKLRDEGCSVKLICAYPYDGFETGWSPDWQKQYQEIIAAANYVEYVYNGYSHSCFQIRNEWMVNRAARVIAVYNGERSGTKNTIDYAMSVGMPVIRIDGSPVLSLPKNRKPCKQGLLYKTDTGHDSYCIKTGINDAYIVILRVTSFFSANKKRLHCWKRSWNLVGRHSHISYMCKSTWATAARSVTQIPSQTILCTMILSHSFYVVKAL